MNVRYAKRQATMALKEIIEAARKYVEAEGELEKQMRAEQVGKSIQDKKGITK